MSKAMNLRQWRQAQLVPDGRGGTRSMTQKELAEKVGVGNSLISRIEKGERWPSAVLLTRIIEVAYLWSGLTIAQCEALESAQLRTWRAYDPSRKGKRP